MPVIADVLLPGVTSGISRTGRQGHGLAVAVSGDAADEDGIGQSEWKSQGHRSAHAGQSDIARPTNTATATMMIKANKAAATANTIRHGKLASAAAAAATTAAHDQYGVTRVKPHVAAATTAIAAALAAARRVWKSGFGHPARSAA